MSQNNRTISFVSPEGRRYRLGNRLATLLVRPRGWHLVEEHVRLDGAPGLGRDLRFTEAGLRNNISVGIQYLGAWLAGNGCVPVFNLITTSDDYVEFVTLPGYQWLRRDERQPVAA